MGTFTHTVTAYVANLCVGVAVAVGTDTCECGDKGVNISVGVGMCARLTGTDQGRGGTIVF